MTITFSVLADKIAALAEVSGKSISTVENIPNGLFNALTNKGLTVSKIDTSGLTSLDTGIVIVRDSSIINAAIQNKRITDAIKFTFLVMIEERGIEGDMDDHFELVKKGKFEFDADEIIHYSVWKLVKVWVNQ